MPRLNGCRSGRPPRPSLTARPARGRLLPDSEPSAAGFQAALSCLRRLRGPFGRGARPVSSLPASGLSDAVHHRSKLDRPGSGDGSVAASGCATGDAGRQRGADSRSSAGQKLPRPTGASKRKRSLAAQSLAAGLLLAFATLLVPAAHAQTEVPRDWALKPAGLEAGDEFRLLFFTSTTHQATATTIATYDGHVRTAVGRGHADIQTYSSQFNVLGSTSSISARDHTSTTGNGGVSIYWLGGAKVR